MKVLIIASGRSGSSQLGKLMGAVFGYKLIYEPFNYHLHQEYDDPNVKNFQYNIRLEDNILVKCIPSRNQFPHYNPHHPIEIQNEMRIDFFTSWSKNFDKVFILDRKDTAKQFFSVMSAHKNNTWGGKYMFEPCTLGFSDYPWMEDYFNIKKEINILKEKINNSIELTYEYLFHTDKKISKGEFDKISKVSDKEFDRIYKDWLHYRHKCNLSFG